MSAKNSVPTLNLDIKMNKTHDNTINLSSVFANSKFEGIPSNQITWRDFAVLGMLEKTGLYDLYVVKSVHSQTKYLAKVLVKNFSNDTTTLNEFQIQQEVAALSKLKHPSLIKLYVYFEDSDSHNLIYELLEEGILYQVLIMNEDCIFEEHRVANYIFQLLGVLDYCHHKNIIHRDIKPENIWLKNNGKNIVLTNFEFSASLKDKSTRRHTFCGTMEYLSPEIVQKIGHNHKTDIWQTGVLCFELLFGSSPFMSENDNIMDFASETYSNILYNEVFESDNNNVYSISESGMDIIKKMLMKNPDDREEISNLLNHSWFKEQLGLSKYITMKEIYEKQKELLNRTIQTNDTKNENSMKNDLEKILLDSNLDKTQLKNDLIHELQDNIDKKFSITSNPNFNNNFMTMNIEMMSSYGTVFCGQSNIMNPLPNKAMSEAPMKNYHKRNKSVNPEEMTILPDICDTPRYKTDVQYDYQLKSSLKKKSNADQDVLLYDNNGNKIYMGALKNNMRDGYGVEYKNIVEDPLKGQNQVTNYAFYKGYWNRGFKQGEGKFTTFNPEDKSYNDIYECKIVKDEIESGKMEVYDTYFKQKLLYIGPLNDRFQMHGEGLLMHPEYFQVLFKGLFKNGQKSGRALVYSYMTTGAETPTSKKSDSKNLKEVNFANDKLLASVIKNNSIVTNPRKSKDERLQKESDSSKYCGGGCNIF